MTFLHQFKIEIGTLWLDRVEHQRKIDIKYTIIYFFIVPFWLTLLTWWHQRDFIHSRPLCHWQNDFRSPTSFPWIFRFIFVRSLSFCSFSRLVHSLSVFIRLWLFNEIYQKHKLEKSSIVYLVRFVCILFSVLKNSKHHPHHKSIIIHSLWLFSTIRFACLSPLRLSITLVHFTTDTKNWLMNYLVCLIGTHSHTESITMNFSLNNHINYSKAAMKEEDDAQEDAENLASPKQKNNKETKWKRIKAHTDRKREESESNRREIMRDSLGYKQNDFDWTISKFDWLNFLLVFRPFRNGIVPSSVLSHRAARFNYWQQSQWKMYFRLFRKTLCSSYSGYVDLKLFSAIDDDINISLEFVSVLCLVPGVWYFF